MEKSQVTPVSQYASWQEQQMVELPTDEINVEKAEEVTKAIEESGITFDEAPVFSPELLKSKTIVQQSMSALKELTNNPEVQKALESEGLTVDYSRVQAILDDEVTSTSGLIRPSTDNDVDTDTMLIVHDLSERLAALEARIALYNTKAAHKI